MFNLLKWSIQAFVGELKIGTALSLWILEPAIRTSLVLLAPRLEILPIVTRPYHDMNHTIMVTSVGQEILLGKHTSGAALPHAIGSIL